jgi:hypothetical protein
MGHDAMATRALAEDLAAWDRDRTNNAHFVFGLGDPPRLTADGRDGRSFC